MGEMAHTFYRVGIDGARIPVELDGVFAGPLESACWLIGSGPSLAGLPHADITAAPIPRMCLNRSGRGLLRPTFWTSYDPSERFDRWIYLDPGVIKFVQYRRAMEFVPGTAWRVCACPAVFCFDRDQGRRFDEFLGPERRGIVDWGDSLVQAIDILCRLGFRVVYLAGCELHVRPSREQIERAGQAGVTYQPSAPLSEFLQRCRRAGVSDADLDALPPAELYHFAERRSIRGAAQTDAHYYRTVQCLRLSRRSMAQAGMRLISVTPGSRLNDYLPYLPVEDALQRIWSTVGNGRMKAVTGAVPAR